MADMGENPYKSPDSGGTSLLPQGDWRVWAKVRRLSALIVAILAGELAAVIIIKLAGQGDSGFAEFYLFAGGVLGYGTLGIVSHKSALPKD